mmetsp:Transcript_31498/g.78004  ORF Transcript_31498/g.78004 Transcript_31498/m.78004 type:complete len:329 (-) Transcript_31498:1083-2069(-)
MDWKEAKSALLRKIDKQILVSSQSLLSQSLSHTHVCLSVCLSVRRACHASIYLKEEEWHPVVLRQALNDQLHRWADEWDRMQFNIFEVRDKMTLDVSKKHRHAFTVDETPLYRLDMYTKGSKGVAWGPHATEIPEQLALSTRELLEEADQLFKVILHDYAVLHPTNTEARNFEITLGSLSEKEKSHLDWRSVSGAEWKYLKPLINVFKTHLLKGFFEKLSNLLKERGASVALFTDLTEKKYKEQKKWTEKQEKADAKLRKDEEKKEKKRKKKKEEEEEEGEEQEQGDTVAELPGSGQESGKKKSRTASITGAFKSVVKKKNKSKEAPI